MTEQAQQILNDMVEITNDRLNKFMSDKKFLNDRVDFMVDLTKKAAREDMSRNMEDPATDQSLEEQQKIAATDQEKFVMEAAMQQIEVLKPIIDEMSEIRYEFTKKLAQLSREDFIEVTYKALVEETKLNVKFQGVLTREAQPRLFDTLRELDKEFDEKFDNKEKESNLRYIGPDELVN